MPFSTAQHLICRKEFAHRLRYNDTRWDLITIRCKKAWHMAIILFCVLLLLFLLLVIVSLCHLFYNPSWSFNDVKRKLTQNTWDLYGDFLSISNNNVMLISDQHCFRTMEMYQSYANDLYYSSNLSVVPLSPNQLIGRYISTVDKCEGLYDYNFIVNKNNNSLVIDVECTSPHHGLLSNYKNWEAAKITYKLKQFTRFFLFLISVLIVTIYSVVKYKK